MKKSINIILIGVLTVASLLLALPFTPLRNSLTNTTSKYAGEAIAKMGVDLNGKIKNARAITGARNYQIPGLRINYQSDYNNYSYNSVNYEGTNGSNSNGAGYGVYQSNRSEASKNNSSGMFGTGFTLSSSKKNTTNNSQLKSINLAYGTTTSLSSTSLSTATSSKQAAGGVDVNGGTHPGVDPTNPPPSLPIGDGTNYMLALLVAFSGWKSRKLLFK